MKDEYEQRGLVKLRQGVDRSVALTMAARLWEDLERRFGMKPEAPETWSVGRPSGFNSLARKGAFADMASPRIIGIIDELFGAAEWKRPAHWGVPLITFPDKQHGWDVPCQHWHSDWPAEPVDVRIARVFVLLSDLQPCGGGTLVAAGSHRLLRRIATAQGRTLRSAQAKRHLRESYRWFAELCSPQPGADRVERFMERCEHVDGVELRVVEMTGEPGDVYFMHPSTLHAASHNAGSTPRMMVTQLLVGETSRARAQQGSGNAAESPG